MKLLINNILKKFFKISIIYFFIALMITMLAMVYNYFLIDKLNINLNLTYISSLLLFGFFSYALNSKYNFKQKISFKGYFSFILNLTLSLFFTLILANLLYYFTEISNFYLVGIITLFNAFLNFVLNLKFTFKYL